MNCIDKFPTQKVMNVKNDHRSKFSDIRNWKEEEFKNNPELQRDSSPVNSANTGAMLCQLSYEATHWERGQFIEFIMTFT